MSSLDVSVQRNPQPYMTFNTVGIQLPVEGVPVQLVALARDEDHHLVVQRRKQSAVEPALTGLWPETGPGHGPVSRTRGRQSLPHCAELRPGARTRPIATMKAGARAGHGITGAARWAIRHGRPRVLHSWSVPGGKVLDVNAGSGGLACNCSSGRPRAAPTRCGTCGQPATATTPSSATTVTC